MLAVLEGGVSDFQKYSTASTGRGRRLFSEACAWLDSTDGDRAFGFENVCHALGLDPAFVRNGLRRWCAARRAQPTSARRILEFPFRRVTTHHVISARVHRTRGGVPSGRHETPAPRC
jgi:hypothetical protein